MAALDSSKTRQATTRRLRLAMRVARSTTWPRLGWTPKISFAELVAEMVREDLKAAERDELVKSHGFKAFDRNE